MFFLNNDFSLQVIVVDFTYLNLKYYLKWYDWWYDLFYNQFLRILLQHVALKMPVCFKRQDFDLLKGSIDD